MQVINLYSLANFVSSTGNAAILNQGSWNIKVPQEGAISSLSCCWLSSHMMVPG